MNQSIETDIQASPRQTAQQKRNGWNGSKWIKPCVRLAIYIRDDFTCNYCGRHLKDAPAADVTLDHIKPRSKGGDDNPRNLITACRSCNSARQNKAVKDYAPGGAIDRIKRQIRRKLNIELAKSIIKSKTNPVEVR
jgi:5-methylcytosine-specific restriction endonuclease McrA